MDKQSKVLEDYALGWNLAELATGIHLRPKQTIVDVFDGCDRLSGFGDW